MKMSTNTKNECYKSQHLHSLLPYVFASIILMHIAYVVFSWMYENNLTHLLGMPPIMDAATCAADESNLKCGKPYMFAFQFLSGCVFVVVGCWAFVDWHITSRRRPTSSLTTTTAAQRLYGHQSTAQWITVINLAYQVWDFAISLTIPELCTLIMMAHHFVAASVAFSAIYNDMTGYYTLFFLGVSEFSSIFLVAMDLPLYFSSSGDEEGILYPFAKHVAGPLFAITFIFYRVILWLPCSLQLYRDVKEVVSSKKAEELRPGNGWVLKMWNFCIFPMGFLQLYWMSLILKQVFEMLS